MNGKSLSHSHLPIDRWKIKKKDFLSFLFRSIEIIDIFSSISSWSSKTYRIFAHQSKFDQKIVSFVVVVVVRSTRKINSIKNQPIGFLKIFFIFIINLFRIVQWKFIFDSFQIKNKSTWNSFCSTSSRFHSFEFISSMLFNTNPPIRW